MPTWSHITSSQLLHFSAWNRFIRHHSDICENYAPFKLSLDTPRRINRSPTRTLYFKLHSSVNRDWQTKLRRLREQVPILSTQSD
jgi:hypothetical protein